MQQLLFCIQNAINIGKQRIIFNSKASVIVCSCCFQSGQTIKPCNRAGDIAERAADANLSMILVDLQMPGLNLAELAKSLESLDPKPRIVAFAQHVNVDLLDQAKGLFAEVMTRGQFNKMLPGLIQAAANE